MIDNNIIQSLGAGSGIDSNKMVKQLTEIERAAPQQRIDDKKETAEAQLSDFALMRSAMNTLTEAAKKLTDEEGLYSKTASYTDSDALTPSALTTDVQPGSYAFEVTTLAQSQSLNFASVTDEGDAVGQGTLTFSFGTWTRDGSDDPTAFTQDTTQETVDITIDSSNNSLEGLRDAINDADFGVQASIIYDGSGYVLSLLADSGASNELQITAVESGGAGLSDYAFNTGVTNFANLETQKGQDAALKINGLDVTRSSNVVDDVVEGLTVNLLKESPGETITVTVSDDKAFAEQNIRDFVDAYNNFLSEIDSVFAFNEETEEYGSLRRDSLAKSVLTQFRSLVATTIPGLSSSNYTALTNIGIRTELDGTLEIDENDFTDALADNFEDVQKLLAPYTESTATDIDVNSFNDSTTAGSYAVVITTQPEKGTYAGNTDGTMSFPNFDTTGKSYTFVAEVNGFTSGTITVPTDVTYADGASLASAIQSAINADETLIANGASVVVSFDTNHFDITSTKYGSASDVNISSVSTDIDNDLGIETAGGTSGTDVAGTIGGQVGFGLGHVLLGALDSSAEGLSLIVGDNATTSTVNFSRGFAGEFEQLVDSFLETNGLFDKRNENLNSNLETYDDDQEALDRRMTAYEERLMAQFIAMENILNGLNTSGGFLDNLINTLPFSASRD